MLALRSGGLLFWLTMLTTSEIVKMPQSKSLRGRCVLHSCPVRLSAAFKKCFWAEPYGEVLTLILSEGFVKRLGENKANAWGWMLCSSSATIVLHRTRLRKLGSYLCSRRLKVTRGNEKCWGNNANTGSASAKAMNSLLSYSGRTLICGEK